MPLPGLILAACREVGVCARCTLRVSGVRSIGAYGGSFSDVRRNWRMDAREPPEPPCPTCLGVLQDPALDAVGPAVEAGVERLTHDGRFKMTASLPVAAALLRDRAMRVFLERKAAAASDGAAARGAGALDIVSLREAVKWATCERVGRLGISYSASAEMFLDLVFEHKETEEDSAFANWPEFVERRGGSVQAQKRARYSDGPSSTTAVAKLVDSMTTEMFVHAVGPAYIPPPPVETSASVHASVSTGTVLLAGNYNKFSRIISQTPWFVDFLSDDKSGGRDGSTGNEETDAFGRKKRTELSVEEVVLRGIQAVWKPEKATFTAGGREDVDVRMLGNGRPFVVELVNPCVVRSKTTPAMISEALHLSSSSSDVVRIRNLRLVPKEYFAQMRECETEKRKHYRCVVWTSRSLTLDELKSTLERPGGFLLKQKTPLRVLHRRTQAVRERQVYSVKVVRVVSANYFVLDVVAQAGTYIKEFVFGDNGRTVPNVGQLLSCDADILQLDVANIELQDKA